MNLHQRKFFSLIAPLAVAGLSAFVGLFLFFGFNTHADAAGPSDEHLITIHDRGIDRSVISRKDTLREVFKEADIPVAPDDLVEPGLDEQLVTKDYQVNIYRARPVVVVDGAKQVRVMSAYQTPKQVARHAGISLRDEDNATFALSSDLITDGASVQLTIDRAVPIQLSLYGKTEKVYTQAKTIEELLKEKAIDLGPKDTVSLARTAVIKPNMKVQIWRDGKQTITKEEKIRFGTKIIEDANRPSTYHEVQTKGVHGKKAVTYEITMKGGKIIKRKKIQSVVLKHARKEVVVVGTKVTLPPGSHEDWMREAGISSGDFGYVNYIVSHESGWRYNAQGYGTTYGLCQAYPGSKMSSAGADWMTNPITQLRWCSSYATGRYGSWQAAYQHWLVSHNW